MASISRVNDANTGGGTTTSSAVSGYTVNGKSVNVDDDPVSNHGTGPHAAAATANGESGFTVNGNPVNLDGNADTCGHARVANILFTVN